MQIKDLEIFNEMPFLFWVKDDEGKYLWGNRAISQAAGEDITGKKDHELIWAENADALREVDKQVLETGKPSFVHKYVDKSGVGKANLSVCKFVGEFNGKRCCFGVSFVIE